MAFVATFLSAHGQGQGRKPFHGWESKKCTATTQSFALHASHVRRVRTCSIEFHKDSLTCSDAIDALEVFCMSVEQLKYEDGVRLSEFKDVTDGSSTFRGVTITKSDTDYPQFDAKKLLVLNDVLDFTNKRFLTLEENVILKSAGMLEFSNMPNDPEAFAKHGFQELEILTRHFQLPLSHSGFNSSAAKKS